MNNEPFALEDVLYRFMPTKEERAHFGYDALVELVVVWRYPFGDCDSFLLFARYPWGVFSLGPLESGVLSILFGHLLRERAVLLEERNGWGDTAQKFGLQRDEAEAALERVERERNVYQQALETYADVAYIGATARAALETGKKLKGA